MGYLFETNDLILDLDISNKTYLCKDRDRSTARVGGNTEDA